MCLVLIVILFHGTMLPHVTYLIMPDKNIHLICETVGFHGVCVAGLSSRVFVSDVLRDVLHCVSHNSRLIYVQQIKALTFTM